MTSQLSSLSSFIKGAAPTVNRYLRHVVGVALSVAISYGVVDPTSGGVNLADPKALRTVGLAVALNLLFAYAGLTATPRPQKVVLYTDTPVNDPTPAQTESWPHPDMQGSMTTGDPLPPAVQ